MGQFALDLGRFGREAQENWQTVSKKVALDLFRRFVMGTPVDTGRARGNWQCTIGSPATGTIDRKDPSGQAVMAEVTKEVGSWNVDQVAIYLTNNVAYIEALENGHSGQAPRGWVKIALRNYPGIVEKAAGGVS
jgi:hypothetical protein